MNDDAAKEHTGAAAPGRSADDDDWFESLGKKAGGAVRQSAPESGLAELQRRQKRRALTRAAAVGGVAVLLVGVVTFIATRNRNDEDQGIAGVPTSAIDSTAAASPDESVVASSAAQAATSASVTTLPPTTLAPTTVAPTSEPPATLAPVSADVAWAAAYLGAEPGPATGEPYKIGWIGGPQQTEVLGNIVDYLNANVGGVQGRPIEIVPCDNTGTDGAPCAEAMAKDDDIDVVLTDLVDFKSSFYDTLGSSKAVALTWHGAPFLIGPSPQLFSTDGTTALRLTMTAASAVSPAARTFALIFDVEIGQFPTWWARPGDRWIQVRVDGGASAEQVAEAIRAVPGAAEADVFATYGFGPKFCTNLPEARGILGSDSVVLRFDGCVVQPDGGQSLDSPTTARDREGTYVLSYGVDADGSHDTGSHVLDAIDVPRPATFETVSDFSTIFGVVRILNGAGSVAGLNGPQITQAIRDYRGPVPLAFGPMNCGNVDTTMPSVCLEFAGLYQYVNGELVAIANGRNGKLLGFDGIVDADPTLFPPIE